MKAKSILFIIICFLLFANFQCDKDPCEMYITHQIPLNALVTEEKYAYTIGDTIWLSNEFNTKLELINGGGTLSLEYGKCFVDLFLMRLEDTQHKLVGYTDFNIINDLGELTQANIEDSLKIKYAGQILYNCGKDKCSFRVGLVPQLKGNYCFLLHSGKVIVQDTSMCPAANHFATEFNVSSHNRQIFKELDIDWIEFRSKNGSGGLQVAELDQAYAFKVK